VQGYAINDKRLEQKQQSAALGRFFEVLLKLGISHAGIAKKQEMGSAGIGFSVESGESIPRNADYSHDA